MTVAAILAPVFVLVLLTFALLIAAALKRSAAIVSGQVRPKDVAMRQPNWPERATIYINAYHNQLELPVLFYALVAFAMITRQADFLFVVMSWIFVAFRLLQAWIFVTSNNIRMRGLFFAGGCFTLLLMWIIFAVRILTA
jgi:hypothetical protein